MVRRAVELVKVIGGTNLITNMNLHSLIQLFIDHDAFALVGYM